MDCILCRYGEIALKGKNRGDFENKLVDNIYKSINKCDIKIDKPKIPVSKIRGRVLVHTNNTFFLKKLTTIFGLVSISPCVITEKEPNTIVETVIFEVKNTLRNKQVNTFRITTSRSDKRFELKSQELDVLVGAAVAETFNLKVNLKKPELNVFIEISDKAYIFFDKIPCLGGLPVGVGGKIACVIQKDKDILATWLMMKRGCEPILFNMSGIDTNMLQKFTSSSLIKIKKSEVSEETFCGIIKKENCKAIVCGNTLSDFAKSDFGCEGIIQLYPLITYTDKEIDDLFHKIFAKIV